MAIDWEIVKSSADAAATDFLDIIKPYLPALAREGPDVFEGFLKHINNKDWAQVDTLMYEKMTTQERRDLESEVVQGVRAAAIARFRRKKLVKEIATRALLRVVLAAI